MGNERTEPGRRGHAAFRRLLRSLPDEASRDEARRALRTAISAAKRKKVSSIWEPREDRTRAYFLLLLSGAHDERPLSDVLLEWREFQVFGDVQVRCVLPSDLGRRLATQFDVLELPALLVGSDPELTDLVKFDDSVLLELAQSPDEIRRFVTRVSRLVLDDPGLGKLRNQLRRESVFQWLKLAYDEVKGVFSVSVTTDGD